jgi:hypothetical protein
MIRPASLLLAVVIISNAFSGLLSPSGVSTDSNFFPIAVWLQSPSNANTYKSSGINVFIGLWNGPDQSQLAALKAANMPVLCDQNAYALANLATYGSTILGWTLGDEPDNAQSDGSGGYGPCISPDTIIKQYNACKAGDAARPVFLNLGQGVSYINYIGRGSACSARTDMYPRYLQGCDIGSFDIYPVNSSYTAVKGNLWYVPKGVDSLRMWSNYQKPAWCWIECTRIDSSSSAKPTPSQVKSEVWMGIIHGAQGIGYFCHSWYGGFKEAAWLSDVAMKDSLTKLNQRIQSLAPVLNSPAISGKVTVVSTHAAVPVDILVKSHGGATYIFAAAMRNDTTTAQFTITGLTGGTSVEVTDENRNITLVGGSFSDKFSGYQIHLYKVNAPLATRAGISKVTVPAVQAAHRVLVINDGRTGVFVVEGQAKSIMYSIQGRLMGKAGKR